MTRTNRLIGCFQVCQFVVLLFLLHLFVTGAFSVGKKDFHVPYAVSVTLKGGIVVTFCRTGILSFANAVGLTNVRS